MYGKEYLRLHGHLFIKYHLSEVDKLTALVVEKKLPPKVYVFFIWMVGYAWGRNKEKRSSVRVPPSGMAEKFNVTPNMVKKWLATLRDLGLIRTEYRVRNNKTGKVKLFYDNERAGAYQRKFGGDFLNSRQHILSREVGVFTGRRKNKFKQEDLHKVKRKVKLIPPSEMR